MELIVVIGVIGVVIGLMIPAVQRAREMACLRQCGNNLRQIGVAFHLHHDTQKRFPSGGWGWNWIGAPSRGSGISQPGGWVYSILPHMGQESLRRLGSGEESPQLEASLMTLLRTPISPMSCPSRRTGGPYLTGKRTYYTATLSGRTAAVTPTTLARGDYAANCGDQGFNEIDAGPPNVAQGDNPAYSWQGTGKCTGIVFRRSAVSLRQISRGSNNTVLAGDRYITSEHYNDGMDWGDNEGMYVGFANDTCRVTYNPPRQDRKLDQDTARFGGAHVGGVNILYCDGSVRFVQYSINREVFRASGSRSE